MRVMSLFAGIGGFDLAAEHMGWETAVQVEIDPWCRKVLAKNFPDAIRHDDIKTFNGTLYRAAIDLVCGGFPCQPYSVAGQRKGDQDDRHLWPEMRRVIQEVSPRWVVGENVRGLLSWNGGLVFEQVCADLETIGYQVQSFIIPACGVDAPHRRDRLWIVAHRADAGVESVQFERKDAVHGLAATTHTDQFGCQWDGQTWNGGAGHKNCNSANTHPNSAGLEVCECQSEDNAAQFKTTERNHDRWQNWPTQSPLCAGNDGVSARLVRRNNVIKAAGNAVVWQVVYQIFKAIEQVEQSLLDR